MRRAILALLAMLAFTAAMAQTPTAFSLSKGLVLIKVTDPQRQLTVFEPLFSRIDELATSMKAVGTKPSEQLAASLEGLMKIPGINATGDFWFVILPPTSAGDTPDNENAQAKKPAPPTYILVPLTNVQDFRDFAVKGNIPCQVFDKYALITPVGDKTQYSGINFDIKLASTRDIVLSFQSSGLKHGIIRWRGTGDGHVFLQRSA